MMFKTTKNWSTMNDGSRIIESEEAGKKTKPVKKMETTKSSRDYNGRSKSKDFFAAASLPLCLLSDTLSIRLDPILDPPECTQHVV